MVFRLNFSSPLSAPLRVEQGQFSLSSSSSFVKKESVLALLFKNTQLISARKLTSAAVVFSQKLKVSKKAVTWVSRLFRR